PIGYTGRYPSSVGIERIVKRLETELQTKCRVLPFGKREVGSVGIVSGGGSRGDLSEAVDKDLDLFITGEPVEVYHLAKDAGINVIFAGHHASEKTGVQSLMKQMRNEFSTVTMVFEDIPTGI
ncbi:MAG: Nif3-like dinuclear metal center hexameric protein, partial [Chitinivibrionales bacterium]